MNREIIENEIKLADDECCIVFDFGCYFPYANPEILTFEFSLGMKQFDDCKMNHRYPNKNYQTISKKCGHKVSKLGYPYIMKLSEQSQSPTLLTIKVGVEDQYITMIFPLQTKMTRENPVCGLSFKYNFDKSDIIFVSYEKGKNNGWISHRWMNFEMNEKTKRNNDIVLNTPCIESQENNTIIYDTVIEPCPVPLTDLLLLL